MPPWREFVIGGRKCRLAADDPQKSLHSAKGVCQIGTLLKYATLLRCKMTEPQPTFIKIPDQDRKQFEAIGLARSYSGDEAAKFVNGVLDGVYRKLKDEGLVDQ